MTAATLLASATVGAPGGERTLSQSSAGASAPGTADEIGPAQIGSLARRLTPRIAARVARIRGLEFERIPVPEVISGERFAEIVGSQVPSSGRADRKLADTETVARMFGVQEPDEQLDVLSTGAPDLAAAAYDTKSERLYVIRDAVGTSRALLEFLLAHELEHALDDQSFGLEEGDDDDDDKALAETALVEGAATSTMIEYAARHLDPLALSAASLGIDPGTEGVPTFVVEQLTWAYLEGSAFVNALRGRQGGWERVDEAFGSQPPLSTEHILHPDAYQAGDEPADVSAETDALETRRWRVLDRGILGEFSTRQVLEVGAPGDAVEVAATGWSGDEYALLGRDRGGVDCEETCAAERIVVAAWRWDSAAEADEFDRTLPAYLIAGRDARKVGAELWSLDGAWVATAIDDEATVMVFAPSRELARAAVRDAVAMGESQQ